MPGGPRVNLTSANEHVPEIERRIRVVKERARSSRHSLPFNRIPRLLTIYIVFKAVKLLNYFPPKGGISDTVSPRTIMTGETLNYKTQLTLQIGQYCQVHEEFTPRNSQLPRTQGAICLGPSRNLQGGFKFMSLTSGKVISRCTWDNIPMPESVIKRVNDLGKDQPTQFIFTPQRTAHRCLQQGGPRRRWYQDKCCPTQSIPYQRRLYEATNNLCKGISQHCGQNIICHKALQAGHLYRCRLPHNKS
jgi:hypothetical protein